MVTLTTSFTPKLNSTDWRSIPNIAKIQLLLSKTSLAQEKQPEHQHYALTYQIINQLSYNE